MRISRNQLRNILIKETKIMLKEATKTSIALDSFKKLSDYLIEKEFEFVGVGYAIVIYEIGDQLIDKIRKDDLEGAYKLFVDRYKASGFESF